MPETSGTEADAAPGSEAEAGQSDEIKAYEQAQQLELERQKKDQKILRTTQRFFDALFSAYPYETSAQISRLNRQRLGFKDVVTLSYAEAPYSELLKQLARLARLGLSATSDGNFVDLGSGTGTMVFAAALYHNFSSVTGIEILDDLHRAAKTVEALWHTSVKQGLPLRKREMATKLLLGDCCYTDWSHADVVWCNATCFDAVMLDRIAAKCADLRPGSFFIIVSKTLPAAALDFFALLDTGSIQMNWGQAAVHYYKRNRVPPPSFIANKAQYIATILRRRALPVFDPKKATPLLDEAEGGGGGEGEGKGAGGAGTSSEGAARVSGAEAGAAPAEAEVDGDED
jgi:hypothetical protein